jgi:CRISPR-associated protein Csb2
VGHQHADGRIRRVLIAEPMGEDGSHIQWAKRVLQNCELTNNAKSVMASLLPVSSNDNVVKAYVKSSNEWMSVTPVILPGYDDGKERKRKSLFLKALRQSGIPVDIVDNVMVRKAPFFKGAQHPKQYDPPRYLIDFSRCYVYIRFHEALSGPLAIGAGRHCGFGIFAGMDKSDG